MTSQNYNLSDIFPKFVTFLYFGWLSVVVVIVFIYFAGSLCFRRIRFYYFVVVMCVCFLFG